MRSPYWDLHFQPGAHIPEWIGQQFIRPERDPRYQIRWQTELPGITLVGLVPAVGLTMTVGAFFLSLAGAFSPDLRDGISIFVLLLFAVLLAVTWAASYEPRSRRLLLNIRS